MPRPSQRTRNKRRVHKTLPGGKKSIDFKERTATSACCSICGQRLTGVLNMSPLRTRKLNRGKRRIWRLRGGQICPSCLREALKEAVRTL